MKRTTIYIDEKILKRARKNAIDLGVSFSALVTQSLLLRWNNDYAKIKKTSERL